MIRIFAGLLAISILLTLPANSQEAVKQKTISVSGLAEMEVIPDEIYVQVELREYDRKGGAKVDIENIKNDFLTAVAGVGINEKDISVQGYQGWDGNIWFYKKNKKKNPELKASITYQVKLASTRKMDELVQKLDDEATQNFFISRVSHSRLQEFKKDLKIQAVKAAKEKAAYLAEAISEKAGEALTINDPNELHTYPTPVYANKMVMARSVVAQENDQAPNVDFKKMKIQFEVNVVFALK